MTGKPSKQRRAKARAAKWRESRIVTPPKVKVTWCCTCKDGVETIQLVYATSNEPCECFCHDRDGA